MSDVRDKRMPLQKWIQEMDKELAHRRARRFHLIALLASTLAVVLFGIFIASMARAGNGIPDFVTPTLNKIIIVQGNRARTIYGGTGTHYLFEKAKPNEYSPRPKSCLLPYRATRRKRDDKRRTPYPYPRCL